MRTFVVGDIHGESGLLERLLDELYGRAAAGDTLVFLGDYINRGPDSRGVIDRVLAIRHQWPGPVVTLAGNHEIELVRRLEERSPEAFQRYLDFYDAYVMVANYADDFSRARFNAGFPAEHRQFLETLVLYHEDEHGLYVHAGIPAGKHPGECGADELVWCAQEPCSYGKPVVYGHKVQAEGRPLVLPDRICVDTGCGFGGPLTAVILPERELVQVWPATVCPLVE